MTSSKSIERRAVEVPEWVTALERTDDEAYFSATFQVEGLQIKLNAVDPSFVRWVLRYLQPLSLSPKSERREECTFFCLYSDELVLKVTSHFAVEDNVKFAGVGKDRAILKCAKISEHRILYSNGPGGVFWLADFDAKRIFIVFSSRTKMPALDFGRTVRDVVTAYLTDQGWTLYHAGAVATAKGALMIVGNPGAGKTSLILALLRGGARYIANEQLFVRAEGSGFRVLGYPLAIAVGLGTALQFPGLSDLVQNPDRLLYPRRRYSARRIAETPRDEWHSLDDKLQLLPEELSAYVGGPGVSSGGDLHAVVVPRVNRTPVTPKIEALTQRSAWQVLSDNLLEPLVNKSRFAWSEMVVQGLRNDDDDDEPSIDGLSNMPAVRFDFSLPASERSSSLADTLLAAIEEAA